MKKEYIEPRISVVTCSSEQIMLEASPSTTSYTGTTPEGPTAGTEQEDVGSKFNSGMSWDDEEEW